MIIYNPHGNTLMPERLKLAEKLLSGIPAKHCFITGSFLYASQYNDIDIFVVSRSKKSIVIREKKATVTFIDFNKMYSLFYHSATKCCVAKNILPTRPLKVTAADYWSVINEAVPTIMNSKENLLKEARNVTLYTEYLKTSNVLDSYNLKKKAEELGTKAKILAYIKRETPNIFRKKLKKSYILRAFYTYSGLYRRISGYSAQRFLYNLAHSIIRNG
jgi:hypothetical protein